MSESKKFPRKGSKVDMRWLYERRMDESGDSTWVVASYNIITQDVNIKTSDGFIRIPVEKLKGKIKEIPKDEKPKEEKVKEEKKE